MICLDTDVLIDFLRGDEKTIEKIKTLTTKKIDLSITSINVFELFKGARSSSYNELELVKKFITNFKILNFEINASEKTAEIFNKLKSQGEIVDSLDLMIASIVLCNNCSLLTRNVKHFKNIPELILEDF